MDSDLISLALQEIVLRDGKGLKEVQQYLRMRYRLEADDLVLKRRLANIVHAEKGRRLNRVFGVQVIVAAKLRDTSFIFF